ncbi:universal stress protein [Streptomyces sp. NPDC047315]|uniref:universal stress protein n=1 Tax=Streptomyces sp. NPDC047315 TaxID=3155142 RepID=UPI0033EE2004
MRGVDPLVVGIDGSESSLEAVDWAADEATRHRAPLHLVHAAALPGVGHGDLIALASHRARQRTDAPVSSEALPGDAVAELVDMSRRARILVLGARGADGRAEVTLGSVAVKVTERSACPVVVVRGAAQHRNVRFGNIVVGVEYGEGSDPAVDFGLREASVRRCALAAVYAWNPLTGTPPESPPPFWYALEAHRRSPAQVLKDALRGAEECYPDVVVNCHVAEEPARKALLRAAEGADLLVVGIGRRDGPFGLRLGLIDSLLLERSPCPVAVVPRHSPWARRSAVGVQGAA